MGQNNFEQRIYVQILRLFTFIYHSSFPGSIVCKVCIHTKSRPEADLEPNLWVKFAQDNKVKQLISTLELFTNTIL